MGDQRKASAGASGISGYLHRRELGHNGRFSGEGYAIAKGEELFLFRPFIFKAPVHFLNSGSTCLLQRLSLLHTLDSHRGCVNSVVWSQSGGLLLSGADDHRLVLTEPYSRRVVADIETAHRANIFSAKFLPGTGDSKIVSCAGDGTLLYTGKESTLITRVSKIFFSVWYRGIRQSCNAYHHLCLLRCGQTGRDSAVALHLPLRDLVRDPDDARRPQHLPLLRRGRHGALVRPEDQGEVREGKLQGGWDS